MSSAAEKFYDRFSRRLLRDYVLGNRRVERQIAFFRAVLPETSRRVLVIGCGSGEAVYRLAREFPTTRFCAVDLSGENVRIARALFPHARITYEQMDVVQRAPRGPFDAVLMPDVYEHIPIAERSRVHAALHAALGAEARILITVPSPGKQAALARSGTGLQIVDEIVTLDDLVAMARDVAGEIVYLNLISVWEANDYIHAAIARGNLGVAPLSSNTRVPISGWPRGMAARIGSSPPVEHTRRVLRAGFRCARVLYRLKGVDVGSPG